MKKNEERDAVARVFRKFARLGLARERLNPLRVYKMIDVCCGSKRSKLDMLAVYDTLRLLDLSGDSEISSAVREVYFSTASHRLAKNEVTLRIRRYAAENYCDERTVYRRLDKARQLYIDLRGKVGLLWEEG